MNFINKNNCHLSYLFLKSIRNGVSLHEEIYVKYSMPGTYKISNEKMIYKKSSRFFQEVYRSISIYFPSLLFFEEIANKKDFITFVFIKN